MATRTAIRSQLFRSAWGGRGASRSGRYAARKRRSSVFRTTDGLTRELLRSVRD